MKKDQKRLILLTNDDGIGAPGLLELSREIKKIGRVAIIAPDTERSAVGHAITTKDPIRVEAYYRNGRFFGSAVSGTPADCVKLAIKDLLDQKPDLVVSGINQGDNSSLNVIYSGTVSAATEGTIFGIPSIAVSLASWNETDFGLAAVFARKLAQKVLRLGLPQGTFLNVNIPTGKKKDIKSVCITIQGTTKFEERFDKRTDPSGRDYYWMAGRKSKIKPNPRTDDAAVQRKEISITPLQYDLTNYSMIETLKKWNIKI